MKKISSPVPFMYVLLSSCDVATGIGAIINSVIFFILAASPDQLRKLPPAVSVQYFIVTITFKVSAFLNLIIAIARTINILQPFLKINKSSILASVIIYATGWTAFVTFELVVSHKDISNSTLQDLYHTSLKKLYNPGHYNIFFHTGLQDYYECRNKMLFVFFPYVLPALIVFGCMVVQLKAIVRTWKARKSTVHGSQIGNIETKRQRKITITILLITILYFICNTVYISNQILFCVETIDGLKLNPSQRAERRWSVVLGYIFPFINAAFNPSILIVRGQDLSKTMRRKLRNIRKPATDESVGNSRRNTEASIIFIRVKGLGDVFSREKSNSIVTSNL